MCSRFKVSQVSRWGFYAWQQGAPSTRSNGGSLLVEHIRQAHKDARGFYGSPRLTRQLRLGGIPLGRGRLTRLMRLARPQGHGNGLFPCPLPLLKFFTRVPNRIRDLDARAPNRLWHVDVSYLKVAGVWRYFAVVMDRFSRRIVGWSLSTQRTAALTIDALQHAIRNRKPAPGIHFHSDRGIEYATLDFKAKLRQHGFI
jgi:putative transposase